MRRAIVLCPVAVLLGLLPASPVHAVRGPAGLVAGEAVSWTTDKPVAGATVELPDFGVSTKSDAHGRFRFPEPLPTDRPYRKVRAVVTAEGLGRWTVSGLPLRPNETLQLHAELREEDWAHRVTPPEERSGRTGRGPEPATPPPLSGETCTGWDYELVPPPDVWVYLHEDDVSKQYDFYFYAAHVLPSEWIPSWDEDALAAGAVAVKTYAAFRAMSGNAYTSGPGCADVRDDTADQVFNPVYSYPTTDAAVYAAMGSILRRDSDPFLAQYWSGAPDDPCEPVTTGTFAGRMSQWGTQTCGLAGEAWPDIDRVFYQDTTWKYLRNILLNPGADSDAAPYPWTRGTYTSLSRVSGGYRSDWRFVVAPTESGQWGNVQQKVPVSATDTATYHASVALQCPQSSSRSCTVNIKVKAFPETGSAVKRTKTVTVSRDGAWHVYTFDPSASGVVHSKVSLYISSQQTFWTDGMYLDTPYGGP